MADLESFYNDTCPWTPPKNAYPTWDNVMRYYISRTSKSVQSSSDQVMNSLSMFCVEVWESGDGCPMTWQAVKKKFQSEVLPVYQKYRKGDIDNEAFKHKKKKKKKKDISPANPSRRSERSKNSNEAVPEDRVNISLPIDPTESVLQVPTKTISTRVPIELTRKFHWLKDHGNKLFDIFSTDTMQKCIAEGKGFDSEFYEDQKDVDKRALVIETMRVRKYFYEQQKELEKTQARKYARKLSALGSNVTSNLQLDDTPRIEYEETPDSPFKTPRMDSLPSTTRQHLSVVTRSTLVRSLENEMANIIYVPATKNTEIDEGTQTEEIFLDDIKDCTMPKISTRKKPTKRGSKRATLVSPAYLQSGALMMSVATMSSSQAILAMKIHDETVYKQTRYLPLTMNKKYKRKLKLLKKYQALKAQKPTESTNDDVNKDTSLIDVDKILDDDDDCEWSDVDDNDEGIEETVTLETEDLTDDRESNSVDDCPPVAKKAKIDEIESSVNSLKNLNKMNLNQVLPDPSSVRAAHHTIATHLEGKIADQMIKAESAFLMPDGTSRQKLGKIGASLVYIEGQVRALKCQLMGNETRENWADTLIHNLRRLAMASGKEVVDIFKTILSFISDKCKVNENLPALVSSKLGIEWIPGTLYCCLHTVLGFQDGIVDVWKKYQGMIGYQKMNPSAELELDMDDTSLVKQVLEAHLRLTADRWSARSWNKFEEYNEFCKDNELSNVGRELHGNRFGDLELCCAIGVYSLTTWITFIETHPNIRNQLTTFIRETIHLADVCNVLWLGAALFGIHVTWPYMSLLLELEATHTDLLKILPEMYKDLLSYPLSLAQLSQPGIPSLKHSWADPLQSEGSPYGVKICEGISKALSNCDITLLDIYLKQLCVKQAQVLRRQRGDAYGFGVNESQELVTNQEYVTNSNIDLTKSPDAVTKEVDSDPLVKKSAENKELVTKQVDSANLDKAPTHTKAVENIFGEEDMILNRFGNQAFEKSSDDLVIKYSKDMLDNSFSWSTQKMRRLTKEIDKAQKEFSDNQKALIASGVTPPEAIQMTAQNRIHRVVEQCRKSHGGPITDENEVDAIVEKMKDEKALKSALTAEIRYRKFTLLKIKESNPLFKQRNLSNEQLTANLKFILQKSMVGLTCSASIEDLERVIVESNIPDSEQKGDIEADKVIEASPLIESDMSGPWPPTVGDHLAVNFVDGFYVGEVIKIINSETVKVSYMSPKKISTASSDLDARLFWYWPSKKDIMDTDKAAVLPLRPVLNLATPPSTNRFVVFKLENMDFIKKIAEL